VPDDPLLAAVMNLSRGYHREHEKFYAEYPRAQAVELQRHSRTFKGLADRWTRAVATGEQSHVPYAGSEDLNDPVRRNSMACSSWRVSVSRRHEPAAKRRTGRATDRPWFARTTESCSSMCRACPPIRKAARGPKRYLGRRRRDDHGLLDRVLTPDAPTALACRAEVAPSVDQLVEVLFRS
jgi:hypothetical protein